jgi:surface carbohydrate biosynthesis protein
MRQVDIVYFYEHAARELDVACAVAAILEHEHQLNVEIIQWPMGFPEVVAKIRPRLVILPFCYSDQGYRMLLAYWRESIFLNLSWEQIFYFGNQKAKTPRGDFALKHVLHQSWSDTYADFLVKAGIPREHIFVNGNPTYALYDEPYCCYFASRTALADRYHLDVSSRWVFFPENYNWAFYSDATIQQFIENGQSPDDIKVMRDYCEQSLAEVLRWCNEAANEQQVEIIVRPRPSTSMDDFLAFVKRALPEMPPLFHIIQQESVREWILASDIIISSHSTSLIEAAVAEKHGCIIAPLPIPVQLHVDWHDLIPHVNTQNDFIRLIGSDISENPELKYWAHSSMMAKGDPIHNLTDYLAKFLQDEIEVPPPLPYKTVAFWFKVIPPAWMWSLYRRLKLFLRHPVTGGVDPNYLKDYVSQNGIRTRVQKWMYLLTSARHE